jgi:ribosomal protein S4
MPYPGYLLNPGDMFQVDVDSVLFATGAPKEKEQRIKGRRAHRVRRNRNISQARFKAAAKAENGEDHVAKPKKPAMQDSLVERKAAKKEIQLMIQKADMALDRTVKLGAKRHAKKRHELRVFKRAAKNLMGQVLRIPIKELDQKRTDLILQFYGCKPGPPTKDAKDHLMKSMERMKLVDQKKIEAARAQGEDLSTPSVKIERVWTVPTLDPKKRVINFRKELASAQENPTDLEKPYATPWQPRPYMSAFAFIPRYLEVHHSICSAVYLRHPVARPGSAEVPSPFPTENQQLAFNWYLRRR